MPTPPANPSVDDLLSQWQAALTPDSRDLFEADVIARYPALAAEFAAQVHELRAIEEEEAKKVSDIADKMLGETVGGYKLIEKIGEGGFGIVFRAAQTEPVRREVALKILKPNLANEPNLDTKQVLARFESERQALALMNHPNIAKVFDAGETNQGWPYFVMELVKGIPITDYCDRHTLSTEERLTLFIAVCQAIQHAHHKGVVHRDIKPTNILVTIHDNVPVPKVIDFGIAKATGARLTDLTVVTMRGFLIGSLDYMSPEQAEMSGLDIDTRADIYSLGVLLYELLTGRLPFDPHALRQAVYHVIHEVDPPKPSTRLTTATTEEQTETARRRKCSPANLSTVLRGELDWVVMRALEKDRTRRYATADAFAEDLRRHLAGEAVEARPPSTFYRLRKLARRHRVTFAASAAVLVSLIVGVAVATAFYFEKRAALDQANDLLYVSDMRLAHRAWEDNQVELARELVARHEARPGRPDLRGFEWFYLHRLCQPELPTHEADITRSPFLAFGSNRQSPTRGSFSVDIDSDALSEREVLQLKGVTNLVANVAFSPDGRRLAWGSQGGPVKIWDATSGQELLTLKGHEGMVSSLAFNPDGRSLASGSRDGIVKIWDATTGQELLTFKRHGDSGLDGNSERRREELLSLNRNTNWVTSLVFSPDGRRLSWGSGDGTVKIWDATSKREVLMLKGHTNLVSSLVFSSGEARLASAAGWDSIVKVWDATSGQELLTLKGHTNWVTSLVFSPDRQRLASGSQDNTVKVWDATSGQELLTLKGHTNRVSSVVLSPTGLRLALREDSRVDVRNSTSGQRLRTVGWSLPLGGSVAFSPDGRRLASGGGWTSIVKVRDATSGKELLTLKEQTHLVSNLVFSPDGRRLAWGSMDGTVKIWDATSGQELLTLKGHEGMVSSLAFNPDGRSLASGSWDGIVKIWDATTGQELLTFKGREGMVSSLTFSPDGRRLASGSWDTTVKIWDARTGQALLTLKGHEGMVSSLAFSPDGRRLASGSRDNTVKAWDATSGQELLTLKGHAGSVMTVAFSPDRQRLASGSEDNTVKVWDATSGQELLTLKGHTNWAISLVFSPDGRRLASGYSDESVRVWDATPQAELSPVVRK